VIALVTGLVFGAGLILGGMTMTTKVIGFLDVGRNWDPSLALVMGGALAVLLVAQRFVRRRAVPTCDPAPIADVDGRLIAGAVLFGLGWGLVGYCPGPAVVSFAAGARSALVFFPSMIVGMLVFRFVEARRVR
jgi:uncharacterized membrane protein YedE/YeeE